MERHKLLAELTEAEILYRAMELYVMAETARPAWLRDMLVRSGDRLVRVVQIRQDDARGAKAGCLVGANVRENQWPTPLTPKVIPT